MNTYFGQIGGKLRQIRLDKGYTLETVAEKLDLRLKLFNYMKWGNAKSVTRPSQNYSGFIIMT